MKIKLIIIACLTLSAGTQISGLPSYANDKNAARSVDDDIPMGSLGYKLGTYLVIEGVKAEKGKIGVKTLSVNKINGNEIKEPIGLWIENVESLPKGKRIIIRGYETGKMIGIPDEVIKKEYLAQPQARWQLYRYFIITSVIEPTDLSLISYSSHVTPSAAGLHDSIDRLITGLSNNPLWMNGVYPSIKLSGETSHNEVLADCFKMTGFGEGFVKDYRITKIKQVKISGSHTEDYFAALADTDLGEKIVLFRYENPATGWWTRVYDSK